MPVVGRGPRLPPRSSRDGGRPLPRPLLPRLSPPVSRFSASGPRLPPRSSRDGGRPLPRPLLPRLSPPVSRFSASGPRLPPRSSRDGGSPLPAFRTGRYPRGLKPVRRFRGADGGHGTWGFPPALRKRPLGDPPLAAWRPHWPVLPFRPRPVAYGRSRSREHRRLAFLADGPPRGLPG